MTTRLLTATLFSMLSSIASGQSSGTAFAIAPDLLVTNHHVIEGCTTIEVISPSGRVPATLVDSSEHLDLALLRANMSSAGVASLRTKSALLLGEPAIVFGFPLGGALSSSGNFTTGVISSLRGLRDSTSEIQFTAPVQPGNSGGPVLDRSGAVIGVVSGRLSHDYTLKATGGLPQNVNFAVSLNVLTDFLKKNNVRLKSATKQPALETTQVAAMAQMFTYKISCLVASSRKTEPRSPNPLPNKPTESLPDALVQELQFALNQKGFNAGAPDGFMGPQTQAAILAAQRVFGLPVTGLPSQILLAYLKNESKATYTTEASLLADRSAMNWSERTSKYQYEIGRSIPEVLATLSGELSNPVFYFSPLAGRIERSQTWWIKDVNAHMVFFNSTGKPLDGLVLKMTPRGCNSGDRSHFRFIKFSSEVGPAKAVAANFRWDPSMPRGQQCIDVVDVLFK